MKNLKGRTKELKEYDLEVDGIKKKLMLLLFKLFKIESLLLLRKKRKRSRSCSSSSSDEEQLDSKDIKQNVKIIGNKVSWQY